MRNDPTRDDNWRVAICNFEKFPIRVEVAHETESCQEAVQHARDLDATLTDESHGSMASVLVLPLGVSAASIEIAQTVFTVGIVAETTPVLSLEESLEMGAKFLKLTARQDKASIRAKSKSPAPRTR